MISSEDTDPTALNYHSLSRELPVPAEEQVAPYSNSPTGIRAKDEGKANEVDVTLNDQSACDAVAFESRPAEPPPPVEVHIAKYVMPPMVSPGLPLERKREGIWHNDYRNQAVADIARGFAKRELAQLWKHGLCFEPAAAGSLQLPCSPGVVIVVESIEHAAALLRLLPEFGVSAARAITLPPTKQVHGIPVNWVMTMVAIDRADSVPADVLINAVGGPHALDLPAWKFDRERGGILIDLADEWDDQAEHDTRVRLRTYSRQVMRLVGADAILGSALSVPLGIPKKSREQRLIERLAGLDRTRRHGRLERFRSWRGNGASNNR